MRGHEPLIAMRRAGRRPALGALVRAGASDPNSDSLHWPDERPDAALLWVGERDDIDRLDLRCLLGLKVVVFGDDDERVRAIARRVKPLALRTVAMLADGETEEFCG
jgi:hypothetical protein